MSFEFDEARKQLKSLEREYKDMESKYYKMCKLKHDVEELKNYKKMEKDLRKTNTARDELYSKHRALEYGFERVVNRVKDLAQMMTSPKTPVSEFTKTIADALRIADEYKELK